MSTENSLIPTEGYLSFMSLRLPYTLVNGEYYVPIKPICNELGIDHNTAMKSIKNDDSLAELHSLTPQLSEDGKRREMFSLPWWTLYGWLYSVSSSRVKPEVRPTLKLYKNMCHKILHDFFVGSAEHMTKRRQMYMAMQSEKRELEILEGKLSTNEDFQKFMAKKKTYQKLKSY